MPQTKRPNLLHAARRRGWLRWSVALFTALSFLMIVSVSLAHVHKSAAAVHECAMCDVVANRIGGSPAPLAIVHQVQMQAYQVGAVTVADVHFSAPSLLPQGRGPPPARA